MSSKAPTRQTRERRDFFRVDQDVFFDYKPVEAALADDGEAENEFEDSISLSLVNELKRLDKDSVQSLRLLTEKNRLLGDYLQILTSKIDVIARHALFAQDSFAQDKQRKRINLSEDGMAFLSDRTHYKGSFMAIRLIFLPNYSPVTSFARVVRCEQKGENHHVAVKFHKLSNTDRQELSRQILKTQANMRKSTK